MEKDNLNRWFVVVNPTAGSCSPEDVRQALERVCTPAGIDCDFYTTTGQEDLAVLVRQAQAEGYHAIVAAGGDGTVSAVADGLLHSATPLGILPVGTSNLVARELNIPRQLAAACQVLVNRQHIRAIDAMQVGERIFISHISMGLYSRIMEKSSALARRRFRKLAYLWNALPELIGKRVWPFHLVIDGTRHRLRASFILLANVGSIGAADLRWGPDIRPDDGAIDICIVRARSLWDYLILSWRLIRHQHHRSQTTYLRAHQTISITTKKDLAVRGDGEIIGRSKIAVQVVPKAIRVIVPEEISLD